MGAGELARIGASSLGSPNLRELAQVPLAARSRANSRKFPRLLDLARICVRGAAAIGWGSRRPPLAGPPIGRGGYCRRFPSQHIHPRPRVTRPPSHERQTPIPSRALRAFATSCESRHAAKRRQRGSEGRRSKVARSRASTFDLRTREPRTTSSSAPRPARRPRPPDPSAARQSASSASRRST